MNGRTVEREEGLAFAKAWRKRQRPLLDRLYPPRSTAAVGTFPYPHRTVAEVDAGQWSEAA